jgi:TolB protein
MIVVARNLVARRRPLLLLALALALAACGGGGGEPAAGTAAPADGGQAVRGEELPGRLLFVRSGVIWQWRGGEARPLLGSGEAVQPAWSPEGQRIAYIARANSSSDVLLATAEGAPLATLTANGADAPPNSIERVYGSRWVFYPTWTRQGASLVVAAQLRPPAGDPPVDEPLGLAVLPAGPGEPVPLYEDGEAVAGRSAVSPDGATLVFTRAEVGPSGRQELYTLPLGGGTAEPVPGAPAPSYDPAFAPDGRWLAVAARDGGGTDIFVLPAAGGAPLRLTSLGSARAPAFSPDGRLLAFLAVAPGEAGFDLWIADLTGGEDGAFKAGEPRRLTTGLGLDGDSGLSWAP